MTMNSPNVVCHCPPSSDHLVDAAVVHEVLRDHQPKGSPAWRRHEHSREAFAHIAEVREQEALEEMRL